MLAVKPYLRWMIRADMEQVLAIEKESFTEPWSMEDFLKRMSRREVIANVAECGQQVVGYSLYELRRSSLRLHRLAVHPEQRRCGIAGSLIQRLIERLPNCRRTAITTVVPEGNLAAQLFFKSMSFRFVRFIRDGADCEDLYLMKYRMRS